jgi:hypothetical protein
LRGVPCKSRLTPPFFIARILGGMEKKMTVKLLLLKSGEDIIADVQEMVSSDDKVIGYFLNKPCVVKMRYNNPKEEKSQKEYKAEFQVSLHPWMPLSKEKVIPLTTEWVVTMVTPIQKLYEMYIEDVLNYGKENDKDSCSDEQPSLGFTD